MTPCLGCLRWLAAVAAASAVLGAQDPGARRDLKFEGVSFTLPPGWEWQAAAATNIAVRGKITVGGREDEVLAELFFSEGRFVNDRVQELQADAKSNPKDHQGLKVEDNQVFSGNRDTAVVTYVKERGQDPPRPYTRRHFLFRRYGHLYEWREEAPRDGGAAASALFERARAALKWGRPEKPAVLEAVRDYVEQCVKYRLPEDWNWHEGAAGPKVKVDASGEKGVTLFVAVTDAMFKQGRSRIAVRLGTIKSAAAVAQVVEQGKKVWPEGVKDPQGLTVEDKIPFRGEKATCVSFTGLPKEGQDETRYLQRIFVFRHKGHVFYWSESCPTGREQMATKLFEEARKGLTSY